MAQVSLGSHVESQVLLTDGQVVFPGFSDFRPALMNDRLDISGMGCKTRQSAVSALINV